MKLSSSQQERLDEIRQLYAKYATPVGGGDFENPSTMKEKRTRKLLDLKLIVYVGVGPKAGGCGFQGGAGLVPVENFDETKHTRLNVGDSLRWDD